MENNNLLWTVLYNYTAVTSSLLSIVNVILLCTLYNDLVRLTAMIYFSNYLNEIHNILIRIILSFVHSWAMFNLSSIIIGEKNSSLTYTWIVFIVLHHNFQLSSNSCNIWDVKILIKLFQNAFISIQYAGK